MLAHYGRLAKIVKAFFIRWLTHNGLTGSVHRFLPAILDDLSKRAAGDANEARDDDVHVDGFGTGQGDPGAAGLYETMSSREYISFLCLMRDVLPLLCQYNVKWQSQRADLTALQDDVPVLVDAIKVMITTPGKEYASRQAYVAAPPPLPPPPPPATVPSPRPPPAPAPTRCTNAIVHWCFCFFYPSRSYIKGIEEKLNIEVTFRRGRGEAWLEKWRRHYLTELANELTQRFPVPEVVGALGKIFGIKHYPAGTATGAEAEAVMRPFLSVLRAHYTQSTPASELVPVVAKDVDPAEFDREATLFVRQFHKSISRESADYVATIKRLNSMKRTRLTKAGKAAEAQAIEDPSTAPMAWCIKKFFYLLNQRETFTTFHKIACAVGKLRPRPIDVRGFVCLGFFFCWGAMGQGTTESLTPPPCCCCC